MYSERYPKRKRQITTRMRLALIICAVLAAAIPVIEYFTSRKELRIEEDLSGRLIATVTRSAELNAALVRLSGDIENLTSLEIDIDVEREADAALNVLSELRAGFSETMGRSSVQSEAERITELLDLYGDALSNAAARRIEELAGLEVFETNRSGVDQVLRRASTELLKNIGTVSAQVEQRLPSAARSSGPGAELEFINLFRDLTLFREVWRLLQDVERQMNALDPDSLTSNSLGIAPQLRFATRGVATRVAKIRDLDTRVLMARDMAELDRKLLGPDGLVATIEEIVQQRERITLEADERNVVATELLDLSTSALSRSRAEAVQSGESFAQLVRNTIWLVLGLSIALLAILLGLLFNSVGRIFAKRIDTLTDSVLAIANGELDRDFNIGGNDELTAMGDALQIFRENSLKLIQNNKALEARSFEIRELSSRLQTILDTTRSGIVAFDRQGQIMLANPPARHFLGGINVEPPFDWPTGINFLDSNDMSPLEASLSPVNRALTGQRLSNELALMGELDTSSARYVRISSSTVINRESPISCVVVLEDVTEAEQNRQRVERTARLDALGQLTGGVAHDFNNLLATIEYALDLSLSGGVSEKAEGYLKTAIGSVRRGSDLTAQLLSFAKRQPGLARSRSIDTILKEFRTLVEPSIVEQVSLQFEVVDPSVFVLCDAGQLENALLNLVLNSRDAIVNSGQGDQITIAVRKLSDPVREETDAKTGRASKSNQSRSGATIPYVEISVNDNGPGMNDEVMRRALDPFFSTKHASVGSGLGLSMVYGFAENSNGDLDIYSEEGVGTTIRLLLPEGIPEDEAETGPAELPMPKGRGEKILIVEDNVELRDVMSDLVSSLNYTVQVVGSAEEAIEVMTDRSVCDLVLSDVVMPGGMGGFELGAELRSLWPDIPIVYMSGYAGFTEDEMGIAKGKLVQKPCSPSELSVSLKKALEGHHIPAA